MKKSLSVAVATAALLTAGSAAARDDIRIVGSSTVFPFSSAVSEQFGNKTTFATPVVEATGTGGGAKLFCAGVGESHPDVTNASRRMKSSEFKLCASNGVTQITEIKVGFDGIVIANDKGAPPLELTLRQVFQAFAKDVPIGGKLVANPYRRWSEIDDSLPDAKIEAYGPPPTSGTRDAFVEIAMEKGARTFSMLKELRSSDKNAFKEVAHTLREDGAWIDSGENDNAIVQTLQKNPKAVGVFGFSFLDQNSNAIKGAKVDGVAPTFENIAAGDYGVSRSLYVYVKKQHVGVIPGIAEFVAEFVSEDAFGEDGYLADKGLIPLPATERAMVHENGLALKVWDGS